MEFTQHERISFVYHDLVRVGIVDETAKNGSGSIRLVLTQDGDQQYEEDENKCKWFSPAKMSDVVMLDAAEPHKPNCICNDCADETQWSDMESRMLHGE